MLGAVPITEHTAQLGELPIFWRSAPPAGGEEEGGPAPVLYLHGVPPNSDDWVDFLERSGGLAPDLPGFGRSGKPGHFDYSIPGYARFLEQYLDLLEVPC